MKPQLFFLFSLFLFNLVSCKKSNVQNCGSLPFTKVSFGTDCRPVIVDKTTTDKFLIINSIEELKSVLHFENTAGSTPCGIDHPIFAVDFSKQSVIIIKKQVQGIEPILISESLTRNCSDLSIDYDVEIKNGGYTAIGNYIGAILISKIPNPTKVNFNIKVLKE